MWQYSDTMYSSTTYSDTSYSSSTCELSPSASAFSSMLSAFIGSVFNGLFSGFFIAFITAWISPFAVLRILAAGVYEFYLTFKAGANVNVGNMNPQENIGMKAFSRLKGAKAATQATEGHEDEEARLAPSPDPTQDPPPPYDAPSITNQPAEPMPKSSRTCGRNKPTEQTVTIFGWLAWIWAAVYTPLSQSIWLSVNIPTDKGALQLVRALSIAVCALPLSFDYKQRYAAAAGRKWGAWAFVAFNVWNSTACLLLGIEAAILLIHGATHADVPIPIYVLYPIFATIWGVASWGFLPPIDGDRPGLHIVADVLMGVFAGLFLAGPAFALWRKAEFDAEVANMWGQAPAEGMGLGEFLRCEGVGFWRGFAAVMP
jgi:hypothetical protein